ncbi:MAG: AIM24 family protein [Candidatus Thermoplasmatota archaeon]|jgi:uncharacterized protein (AIM24 family)|nr:AIM24 family protein [Candidatus Thermoplasmatota archaeon]
MKADTVGSITPAILVTLNTGEKVLSEHGIMLYMEPTVKLQRRTQRSLGVSRAHLMGMHATGDNEENYFFAEFEGPGHVTFSRDRSGDARILNLNPQQGLRVRSGHLVCFDESVRYYPMVLARWVTGAGDDQEVNYIFADELTGPGGIVFQSYGNILSFQLQPGETIRTSVHGLLALENTVTLNLNWLAGMPMNSPFGGGFQMNSPFAGGMQMGGFQPNNAIPVLDLTGPGVVMVHSGL